jgi:hypothetical protein
LVDPAQLLEWILKAGLRVCDQRKQLVGELDSPSWISLGDQSRLKGRCHMPREDKGLVCEIHGSDVGLEPDQGCESTLQLGRNDALIEPSSMPVSSPREGVRLS